MEIQNFLLFIFLFFVVTWVDLKTQKDGYEVKFILN